MNAYKHLKRIFDAARKSSSKKYYTMPKPKKK